LCGILTIAAIVGGVFGSWTVFLVMAGTLTALLMHGGDIRTTPTSRHQRGDRQHRGRRR